MSPGYGSSLCCLPVATSQTRTTGLPSGLKPRGMQLQSLGIPCRNLLTGGARKASPPARMDVENASNLPATVNEDLEFDPLRESDRLTPSVGSLLDSSAMSSDVPGDFFRKFDDHCSASAAASNSSRTPR